MLCIYSDSVLQTALATLYEISNRLLHEIHVNYANIKHVRKIWLCAPNANFNADSKNLKTFEIRQSMRELWMFIIANIANYRYVLLNYGTYQTFMAIETATYLQY